MATFNDYLQFLPSELRDFLAAEVSVSDEDLDTVFVTVKELDFYVDPVSGSDTNAGTRDAPFSTVQAAVDRIPHQVEHNIRVHMKAGTYVPPTVPSTELSSSVLFYADEEWDPAVFTVVDSGTAGGGTDSTTVVGSGFSTNAFRRRWVRMTSGAAAGQRRLIRNNTTTDIVPAKAFSPAPSPGDTFEVISNACVWDVSDTSVIFRGGGAFGALFGGAATTAAYWAVAGVSFQDISANYPSILLIQSGGLSLYGCDFDDQAFFDIRNAQVFSGQEANGAAELPANVLGLSNQAWSGYGCAMDAWVLQPSAGSDFTGSVAVLGTTILGDDPTSRIQINGGVILANQTISGGIVFLQGAGFGSPALQVEGTLVVNQRAQLNITLSFLGGVTINPTGIGIDCVGGQVLFDGALTGTPGGAAVRCRFGGQVLMQGAPALVGDYENGDGSPVTQAAFSSAGVSHCFLSGAGADGSLIQRIS